MVSSDYIKWSLAVSLLVDEEVKELVLPLPGNGGLQYSILQIGVRSYQLHPELVSGN